MKRAGDPALFSIAGQCDVLCEIGNADSGIVNYYVSANSASVKVNFNIFNYECSYAKYFYFIN